MKDLAVINAFKTELNNTFSEQLHKTNTRNTTLNKTRRKEFYKTNT